MQVAKEKGFEKRAQFYASKTYSSQLFVKGKYHKLKEIVFLAISDKILFPQKKNYKSDNRLLDKDTHEHDLKDFSFTFLELAKFKKTIDQLKNIQEKWAYFFKHAEETSPEDLKKIIGTDLVLQQAYTALDRFSWSEEDLRNYEQAEKYEGAYIASMDQKYDEGKVERNREIAKEMLLDDKPIKKIIKYSNLTSIEISEIKKSLAKSTKNKKTK